MAAPAAWHPLSWHPVAWHPGTWQPVAWQLALSSQAASSLAPGSLADIMSSADSSESEQNLKTRSSLLYSRHYDRAKQASKQSTKCNNTRRTDGLGSSRVSRAPGSSRRRDLLSPGSSRGRGAPSPSSIRGPAAPAPVVSPFRPGSSIPPVLQSSTM